MDPENMALKDGNFETENKKFLSVKPQTETLLTKYQAEI